MLRAIYGLVDENEDMLIDALKYDLQKPSWEARGTELDALYVHTHLPNVGSERSRQTICIPVSSALLRMHSFTWQSTTRQQSEWTTQ